MNETETNGRVTQSQMYEALNQHRTELTAAVNGMRDEVSRNLERFEDRMSTRIQGVLDASLMNAKSQGAVDARLVEVERKALSAETAAAAAGRDVAVTSQVATDVAQDLEKMRFETMVRSIVAGGLSAVFGTSGVVGILLALGILHR